MGVCVVTAFKKVAFFTASFNSFKELPVKDEAIFIFHK